MDTEVKEKLKEGPIRQASTVKGEFLSNSFLVKKKDGGQRPVISLKHLNTFITCIHFKTEGLQNLRYLLQEGDYICKLDLKDAYYCVPLQKNSRKYVRFRWSGNLCKFPCLCFGLVPAPRIFTKLLKIPIAILRRIIIKTVIYLDGMLLMGHSIEEINMCRNTVIFLLQHLGFVINSKKSVLTPVQEIEFLGLKINSVNLEISLTEERIQKVKTKCQNLLKEPATSILELTRVTGSFTSTIQAVLPARLLCRYLRLHQISSLKESDSYQQTIVLNHQSKTELLWWITNLDLCNGQSLIQSPAQVLLQTDLSKRLGATCNGISAGGNVASPGNEIPHQYSRIISTKTSHTDIHKIQRSQSSASSSRQYCGLNICDENWKEGGGGTQNLKMEELAKEIWEYLLKRGIKITAEYLPREMNVAAD